EDASQFRKPRMNNIYCLPNPVSAPEFSNANRRKTFFARGRYTEQKGLHFLLSAGNRIAVSIPEWNLELYGEGPLRPRLQEMIDDLSIPRVKLMGKTDRVGDVIVSSEVHVLSSEHEGRPISIVEAGLVGDPTVTFAWAPGGRELIQSGRDGVVVPPLNTEELAQELLRVARDESLLEHLSKHCTEDMQRFLPSKIVDRWENLFVEMSR